MFRTRKAVHLGPELHQGMGVKGEAKGGDGREAQIRSNKTFFHPRCWTNTPAGTFSKELRPDREALHLDTTDTEESVKKIPT